MKKFLPDIHIEILDFSVNEIQDFDCANIAYHKVFNVFHKIQKPCFAIDSGIYISALNDFPWSYTKQVLETIGIEKILKLLEWEKNRKFYIKNSLAFYDGKNSKIFSETFSGNISEYISETIYNDFAWSELYKIIIPENCTKTLAEMNNTEYSDWNAQRDKNGILSQFSVFYKNIS